MNIKQRETYVARLSLNTRDRQRTLLLLDLVAVLTINVGSLDLCLQGTGRELVHRVCNITLELTVDDSCGMLINYEAILGVN